jgi:dihydroorotate dehydrogenase
MYVVAHNAAIFFARHGFAPRCRPPTSVEQRVNLKMNLWGLEFASPIGLAAGFDKDGLVVQEMIDLGFDFVEVGTVTPLPQSGNPERPRMWRIPLERAIVNRYGFNNAGSQAVRENLERYLATYREQEPQQQQQESSGTKATRTAPAGTTTTTTESATSSNDPGAAVPAAEPPSDPDESVVSRSAHVALRSVIRWVTSYQHRSGIVGVSLGKNRDTPESDAVRDYVRALEVLGPVADFLVVNVSSPNTAGLRDWQELTRLENLLRGVLLARLRLGIQAKPLLVKLSPDLDPDQLSEIGKLCLRLGIDGIVMSNTTALSNTGEDYVRWKLDHPHDSQLAGGGGGGGGLSGSPLLEKSTEGIRVLFRATQGKIPIVGVGGIMTARDCVQKLKAGASLVQIYSGMVYQGPGMVSKIRRDLAQAVIDEGVRSAEELIGMDHEDLYWSRQQEKMALQRRFHSRVVAAVAGAGAGAGGNLPPAIPAAAPPAAGWVASKGTGVGAATSSPSSTAGKAPPSQARELPTQPRPQNFRNL